MSKFDKKADTWDTSSMRVNIAKNIYDAIYKEVNLTPKMHLIDFGAGTGLLSREIALHVDKLVAIDSSPKMLEKLDELGMNNISTVNADICEYQSESVYNGVVSSMTMHHVKDLDKLFAKLYSLLDEDGFIAIADLMREDGSFHLDNDGVHHFGFDEEDLIKIAQKHGFHEVKYQKIFDINKENKKNYGIFLLTAKK